jgi:hypothetical protein
MDEPVKIPVNCMQNWLIFPEIQILPDFFIMLVNGEITHGII